MAVHLRDHSPETSSKTPANFDWRKSWKRFRVWFVFEPLTLVASRKVFALNLLVFIGKCIASSIFRILSTLSFEFRTAREPIATGAYFISLHKLKVHKGQLQWFCMIHPTRSAANLILDSSWHFLFHLVVLTRLKASKKYYAFQLGYWM